MGTALTIIIAFTSLIISLLTFIFNRTILWRNRYWDRWQKLAESVLTHNNLIKLWSTSDNVLSAYTECKDSDQLNPDEIAFAEMYIDYFVEVNSFGLSSKLFLGGFIDRVGISNPFIILAIVRYLESEYTKQRHRKIIINEVERVIRNKGMNYFKSFFSNQELLSDIENFPASLKK